MDRLLLVPLPSIKDGVLLVLVNPATSELDADEVNELIILLAPELERLLLDPVEPEDMDIVFETDTEDVDTDALVEVEESVLDGDGEAVTGLDDALGVCDAPEDIEPELELLPPLLLTDDDVDEVGEDVLD